MTKFKELEKICKEIENEQKILREKQSKENAILAEKALKARVELEEERYRLDSSKVVPPDGCKYDKENYYPIFIQSSFANESTSNYYRVQLLKLANDLDGGNKLSGLSGFVDSKGLFTFAYIFKRKYARELFIVKVLNLFGGATISYDDLSEVEMMGS